MKIILLSGGSGKRLWPLSNDARSKQFLKLLPSSTSEKESMIQRIVRQITAVCPDNEIIVTTGINQKDSVENQLSGEVTVVTEPSRRSTFPAILLACSYLESKGTASDEPVIVIPCDTFTEDPYFQVIQKMGDAVKQNMADIVLLGISPTYPSAKYGYIVPYPIPICDDIMTVKKFIEKPEVTTAQKLINEGGLWNGGVFGFRLGYLLQKASKYTSGKDYFSLRENFDQLPKISFDYEIVEKAESLAVIAYSGEWKDLGTWNTLTDELGEHLYGNVYTEQSENTYIINELELPLICIGGKDLIIAASPDGILVSERKLSENLKHLVNRIGKRPMFEERRWGQYKVIDYIEFPDGNCALTKQLTLRTGCSISYQLHNCREEIWTFIDGEGEIVLDGKRKHVKRGDVINIPRRQLHTLRAITPLTFIEVQQGSLLSEEDIERFEFTW